MTIPRPIQNGVVALAIVVELVVLAGHYVFGWGPVRGQAAATPATLQLSPAAAPSARGVLRSLAAAARREAARDPAAPAGPVAYVRLATWALQDQAVSGRRAQTPLTRQVLAWRVADGGGREVVVERTRGGTQRVGNVIPAVTALPDLYGAPGTLERRLHLRPGASTAQALATFAALAATEPIPARAEAQILTRLAGDAGLSDGGVARDRAGRAGVVITFTAPQGNTVVLDTLVLDRSTGALLEFDRTLAGDPGARNVANGALLSYTVYLDSAWVRRVGQLPTSARARPRGATPAPR